MYCLHNTYPIPRVSATKRSPEKAIMKIHRSSSTAQISNSRKSFQKQQQNWNNKCLWAYWQDFLRLSLCIYPHIRCLRGSWRGRWHLGNIQKCFKAPLFPVVYRPPPPFPPFHHYTFIFNFEMAFSENASYKICNTPSFRSGASSFATLRDPLSSERNCNEYKLESLSNTASENLNFRTVYKHHQKCKKHKEIFLLNSMVCAYWIPAFFPASVKNMKKRDRKSPEKIIGNWIQKSFFSSSVKQESSLLSQSCGRRPIFWFFANQFTVMGAFEKAAKIHFQRFLD